MARYAAFVAALLLAGCGADFSRAGRVPGNQNLERAERLPSNAAPQPPGSMPR